MSKYDSIIVSHTQLSVMNMRRLDCAHPLQEKQNSQDPVTLITNIIHQKDHTPDSVKFTDNSLRPAMLTGTYIMPVLTGCH